MISHCVTNQRSWKLGNVLWHSLFSHSRPLKRQRGQGHHDYLGHHEGYEPRKGFVHEPIRMQSDPEHIDAEPGPARHDISKDGHDHEAALPNEPTPARLEYNGGPKHDQERSNFLLVPSPRTAPRLVSPNPTKD